jgi:hypothetical protein
LAGYVLPCFEILEALSIIMVDRKKVEGKREFVDDNS